MGVGSLFYLFFLDSVFRYVMVFVFGLLFRNFGHFLTQTCEGTLLLVWQVGTEE